MNHRHSLATNPTIFGKILRNEIPAKVVFENDYVLAIHDIHPEAPIHIVIISKQHLIGLQDATPDDSNFLGQLMASIPDVAKAAGVLESGFRIVINTGPDSQGEVPHLHLHLLGGKPLGAKILG